jgi:ketosteroid isomerase-like protein
MVEGFDSRAARLRSVYDSFNGEKQFDLEFVTADVEFMQPDEVGGGEGVYVGREGLARGLKNLLEIFGDVRAEPEEFLDADPYVVVFVRLSGEARGGVRIEAPFAHVWRFRGEQVDLWHAYPHRQEALEFAGLAG